MNKIILLIVFLIVFLIYTVNVKDNFKSIPLQIIQKNDLLDPIYNRFKNRFERKANSLLPGVDAVYVISMPKRKDYIISQMKKLGINPTYFDAVKPDDLKHLDIDALSTLNVPGSRIYKKYTRLCVLLSFIMCFMDSLAKGYSTIVIFEDDVSTVVDKTIIINGIQEFNESDLDVFYMGYCFLNCGQRYTKYKNLIRLADTNLLCCHSVCIKTQVLPKLIDYCFPMTTNSDELFRNFYVFNNIGVCVPKSIYFTQNRESLESLNESIEDPELFKTCNF
jgi:hypothetical protein